MSLHARSLFHEVLHINHHWHILQSTAEQRRVKPQSTQLEYAETSMDHKATSNTEYAMVAYSNTSAQGHLTQGPSCQANTTCTTGPGNSPLEYATVHDALHETENDPQSHPSLTNTKVCHYLHPLPLPAHQLGLASVQTVCRMQVTPLYQTVGTGQTGSLKCAV